MRSASQEGALLRRARLRPGGGMISVYTGRCWGLGAWRGVECGCSGVWGSYSWQQEAEWGSSQGREGLSQAGSCEKGLGDTRTALPDAEPPGNWGL